MRGNGRPPGRFRRRLAIVAVVLATVPAAAVGYALIAVNQDALEDTNRELLFSAIDDVSQQLDRSVDDATTGLVAIARTLGDDELEPAARIVAAKHMVAASVSLSVVGIYDETGARVDVVRDVGNKVVMPDRLPDELRPAADASSPRLGAPEWTTGGAALPIVAPIHLPTAVWFAYARVSLAPLDDAVAAIAANSFGGSPGAVFVVDRQLRVVANGDPERPAGPVRSDAEILVDLDTAPAGKQFLAFRTYRSPRGPMIGAVRSLPTLPFAVVAQLPEARAFASITRMRDIVIAVVVAAMLVAAAIALVFARRLSAPVGRLVRYAGELAARRFDAAVDVRTGDELEVLGDAMQGASRALAAGEVQLRREAAIRSDLGRYLPSQLVDKIVDREQSLELGGQRRTVTLLFADVTSFTTLVERHPPEQVVTILNQLFTILTEIVFRHGGTVDKFIGDCVMAFWNAPDDQPDHAARAVGAAIDMMRWLEVANEAWQAQFGVTIFLAIGVHTGEVVIGNFGSETRMEYTCIGDAVNLAARLESIARPLQILISRDTQRAAGGDGGAFDYVAIGPQRIPGRLEPVELFEVAS